MLPFIVACFASASWARPNAGSLRSPIKVEALNALNTSQPIAESFVSFSIEFSSFPDYAGNLSHPNTFSYNLLSSISNIIGSMPIVRVGGNTQDYAIYDPLLPLATNGTFTPASQIYPTILTIGKPFFQSFQTWPGTKFTYGLNLAKNGTVGYSNLVATVLLACEALQNGSLANWELGNEPDLYKTSAQGPVRPSTWKEQDYASEWLNKTAMIKKLAQSNCPQGFYSYLSPSFAGTTNSLDPLTTWHDGLDGQEDIALISSHNYIGSATQSGITLQGTLMNHSATVASIAPLAAEAASLANYSLPFILGETNSLSGGGAPGLSSTSGAALWALDYNLWCATQGIYRVHMHLGTDFPYAAWQPVPTDTTPAGTRPPFYASIAVAAALGNLALNGDTRVAALPLEWDTEAAYAVYVGGRLARLAVVNLAEYNYSAPTPGPGEPTARPEVEYAFEVSDEEETETETGATASATVQRLLANGSDATTGVTFDGYSYDYELGAGRPVRLANVTVGEQVRVGADGVLRVVVPYSSAAILSFE